MRLAVLSVQALELSLSEFEDYLNGGQANRRFAEVTRGRMQDRRLFFLRKGGEAPVLDSRSRAGLGGKIERESIIVQSEGGPPAGRSCRCHEYRLRHMVADKCEGRSGYARVPLAGQLGQDAGS